MMRGFFSIMRRLWRDERGLTAIEFGFILPLIAMMFLGTSEFGRLLLITQKVQNSTFVLADLTGRGKSVSEADMRNVFFAMNSLIKPFEFSSNGVALVTSVSGTSSGGKTRINWQRKGGGTLGAISNVGTVVGGSAALPGGLALDVDETVVVTEIFYDFEPLFGLILKPKTIYRSAVARPRLGTLESIDP